jgi:hypothetical protein
MILINFFFHSFINEGVIVAIDDNKRMFLRKHIATHPTKGINGEILFFIMHCLNELGGTGPHGNNGLEEK